MKINNLPILITTDVKKYTCNYCDFSNYRQMSVLNHMAVSH